MSDKLSDQPAYWEWCPLCRHGLDTGLECSNCGYDMMPVSRALSDYAALKAEKERWRRDAERYRWICQFPEEAEYVIVHAAGCDGTGYGPTFRDLLSDAIDAALSAVPKDDGKYAESMRWGAREPE